MVLGVAWSFRPAPALGQQSAARSGPCGFRTRDTQTPASCGSASSIRREAPTAFKSNATWAPGPGVASSNVQEGTKLIILTFSQFNSMQTKCTAEKCVLKPTEGNVEPRLALRSCFASLRPRHRAPLEIQARPPPAGPRSAQAQRTAGTSSAFL